MIFNHLHTSFRDRLSGLYSEEYFAEVFRREWHRMLREKDALSVLIIHPHLNTNREDDQLAFKLIAETVSGSIKRATDLVCRFQGDEIAIGLFNLDENGTETIVNRIIKNVQEDLAGLNKPVDLSIGALNVLPSNEIDLDEIFDITEKLADDAELKGKNSYQLKYFQLH